MVKNMKRKIFSLLFTTTALMNISFASESTCTTTTAERAALECGTPPLLIEQQRFSRLDLFALPFFEQIKEQSNTALKQWVQNVQKQQEQLKTTLMSGLTKKVAWAKCDDKTSDEANTLIYEAKAHFLSAAEGGSDKAMIFLSDIYRDEGNFIEAFYWSFLGIEINWIINGTISDTSYSAFQQLCQMDQIQQNTEARAIVPVIEGLKTQNALDNLGSRLFHIFSSIFYYYQINSFIASQQVTGIAHVTNHSDLWYEYGICLEHPFIRPDLAINSIERQREKYKAYVHAKQYANMAKMLLNFPIFLEEFHKDRKDKSIDNFIGDLYWKGINNKKSSADIRALCYCNLSTLIFQNRYSLNEKGQKIRPSQREEFATQLLKKSLELNTCNEDVLNSVEFLAVNKKISMKAAVSFLSKALYSKKNKSSLVIEILAKLIFQYQSDVNERGEKISSTGQRYEALGRLYYQALAKGFPFYLSLLGGLILKGHLKYDQNNQLIPEEQRVKIGTKFYYDTLKYISQLDTVEKEKYKYFKAHSLQGIAMCLADKEINTDENNQPVSDEDRSKVCARIFNQSIASGYNNAKYELGKLIYERKIHHRQDGSLITSQEQRYAYTASLFREHIQQITYDIEIYINNILLMIFHNETDRDENNNIILPENKLDWMIEKLNTDKMQRHVECKILLYHVLLEKSNDLVTKKKAYTLIKEAVMAGKTVYFEQMENLKSVIDEEEKALFAEYDITAPETQSHHVQTDEQSLDLGTTTQTDDHSSSNSEEEEDDDEGMTQTSTSSIETAPETAEERALRKAQAKADRLFRAERREAFKKQLHQRDFSALKKMQKLSDMEKHQKYALIWTDKARVDFDNLLEAHRKKLTIIIDDIKNNDNPYNGAEKLQTNLRGWFSRRISSEHRFVFQLSEDQSQIIIKSCYGHYD